MVTDKVVQLFESDKSRRSAEKLRREIKEVDRLIYVYMRSRDYALQPDDFRERVVCTLEGIMGKARKELQDLEVAE
jgi:hypothetical protein